MKVGILGAGQLARMIALAGYPLGIDFVFLDPAKDACANALGTHLHGAYDDPNLLAQLAELADVVTYEFENVPADVAQFLADHTEVHPSPNALAVAQDRLSEKSYFNSIGIPTPAYAAIESLTDLTQAMDHLGWPAIVKSRRMGYDGKGQTLIHSPNDLTLAWERLEGAPAIIEAFVPFDREVSIIAARSPQGEFVFYPLSENVHKGGILRVATCREDDPLQQQAEAYATRLLEGLDYVGLLALELFEVGGRLLANEFAPRVHNSGHWTTEGTETSQFENHLRAILSLPLGSTRAIGHAAMVNFIGGLPETSEVLAIDNAHLHLYGKSPRKGRKVAHATLRTDSNELLDTNLIKLRALADRVDDS